MLNPQNPLVDSATILNNPGFAVLLVIIFMGTRERTYFSVVRRTVLSLGSPVADPETRM